ncbi:type III pantothenate kinase [Brumimicrobium oceani]|uniref:Type III pantothenate kinase n=1 Tax=Brumimicrobium oceani TaxID=2100725 RepID=A0A2U2XDQ2_9FLAO|nr:type III pantothenate kinase [Brumimicrobium oceani]PWH85936.1 pantothenate kinase [Brumimicrobium oceani]PWH85960.1 pantothenate kinase [Brumimicrobium oceani]
MKQEKTKFCVVDAGNTRVKVIDFENGEVLSQVFISIEEKEKIKSIISSKKEVTSILSSVLNEEMRNWIADLLQPNVVLSNQTPLPIRIDTYRTPQTLGADRIANAVAANHYSKTTNSLVIDIGTCIKFDFVQEGKFIGGSISPGYGMRLKAMHEFTGGLPLLELEEQSQLIGDSTKNAMMSGVLNGIQAEIEGFINQYNQQYQPLTIFLTGGDLKRFDKELKNSIFADDYLTVKGLYLILKHNV